LLISVDDDPFLAIDDHCRLLGFHSVCSVVGGMRIFIAFCALCQLPQKFFKKFFFVGV
jgi:hypothetical protein